MSDPIFLESDNENENENSGTIAGSNECVIPHKPVSMSESGEGLPYAPTDFPKPGDNWIWKVGRRINMHGFMQDRFLFPPKRFKRTFKGKPYLASKKAVEDFVMTESPNTNLDDFWSSFHWKVPAKGYNYSGKDESRGTTPSRRHRKQEIPEHSGYEGNCKARNKRCHELQAKIHTLPAIDCDLCCSETGFCRDCCCILCCRTIQLSYEGYSFIRCEATVKENYICGHVAHLDCALRAYMAGTVGGTIGLDVEYYCRRCDNRTNLIPHIKRLLNTCQSIDSEEDIEKILSMGSRILRGSKQDEAKTLQDHIDLALGKLQNGDCLHEIRDVEEDDISTHSTVRERREKKTPMKRRREEVETKRVEKERRKREEMDIKRVEKDIQKIIKRFPDDVLVAADDDDSSSCLDFETTPLNQRIIKTRDLVSVVITFDSVKKEKQKHREWFTVEESGNRTWISYAEVDGLIPRKWVTGNTIDWYGIKLREMMKRKTADGHHQQYIICNNFFYTILATDYKKHMEKLEDEEEYREMDFQNRTAVFAPKLNSNWTNQIPANDVQSSILIPINYRNNHWALFVVHPIKRTIDLYDPLYKDHEVLKNYDEEMNALVTMLSMYYVHKDPITANIDWEKKVCCNLPKQPNHYDCGVLVIAYMDCICREVEIEFDEQKTSEYFRYILARDLLKDGRKLNLGN